MITISLGGAQLAILIATILASQVVVTGIVWLAVGEQRAWYAGYLEGRRRMFNAITEADTNPAIQRFPAESGDYPRLSSHPSSPCNLNPAWDADEPAPVMGSENNQRGMIALATVPMQLVKRVAAAWR